MAYTSQTFTFQAVLTAAEMNQMQTNLTEIRTQHKGSSAPAELEAGVMWVDDGSSPWTYQIFKNGATAIEIAKIDDTNDLMLYETGHINLSFRQSIQYVNSAGTLKRLIGIDVTPNPADVEFQSPAAYQFRDESGVHLITFTGSGQIRAEDGTAAAPAYGFDNDDGNGMFRNGSDEIGFSLQNTARVYMRGSQGIFGVGKNVTNIGSVGTALRFTTIAGQITTTVDSGEGLLINRLTNDGKLIAFFQDGTEEGDISVSGTTVSLTGGHLARLTQLPGAAEPRPIPRGTIMAVSSELAAWSTVVDSSGRTMRVAPKRGKLQRSEQVMRCDVSATPGDRAVYGVFDRWAVQSSTENRDMYIACTGDFICRVTGPCEPGDLLESAGDGTARVQGDDLIRSATLGRVSLGVAQEPAQEALVPVQLLIG